MSICLSHMSADRALETLACSGQAVEMAASSVMCGFEATDAAVSAVSDELESLLGPEAKDLNLLVGADGERHATEKKVIHKWTGPLPEGSLAKVCEGLYVSTPSFCLLQQAAELHTINLCQMLGRYLAVATPKGGRDGKTLQERAPLLEEEALGLYLSQFSRPRGAVRVREAMRWTAAGAASPQETNLQLALTLPYAYGGFGLVKPLMNYRVTLSEKAKALCGKDECYIDLYWRGKSFGIEYQGMFHNQQIGEDYARFYALDCMGKQVLFVADAQLWDAVQMEYIAHRVARRLGKKVLRDHWPDEDALQGLLDALRGARVPNRSERRRSRRTGGTERAPGCYPCLPAPSP